MKIKTRLLLGFGAILLLMSALAGIGINRLFHLSNAMDEVYQNRYTKVKLAYNIRTNVTAAARSLANLIMNDPATDVAKETDNANQSLAAAGKDFIELGKTSQDPAEKKVISDITAVGKKYYEYKDQVLRFIASNQVNAAYELRKGQGAAVQSELLAQLDLLVNIHEQAMNKAYNSSTVNNKMTIKFLTTLVIAGLLIGLGIMIWIICSISNGLGRVVKVLTNFSNGDIGMASRINVISKDEIGEVAKAFNSMVDQIESKSAQEKEYNLAKEEQAWLKSNVAQITTALQGARDMKGAAQTFMSEIAGMIHVNCGSFYLNETKGITKRLNLYGVYAYKPLNSASESVEFGEGLIGQCALDKKVILLKNIPAGYMKVYSSLGQVAPVNLLLYPVLFEGDLIAVIELASLSEFDPIQLALLDQLSGTLGITISSISGRNRVEELLRISQALTDELQAQSEALLLQQNELKDSNERLQTQTIRLLNSEELLQQQQEELQESNDQLQKKTELLEEQIRQTEQINSQIQKTKTILEQQTQQLAASSRYKSEFLANMSHELRTPLNSMLILSQLLAENKEGNMQPKQVEFAHAIHESGSDLIRLINEILDLSKVEAGQIEIVPEVVQLSDMSENISRSFIFLAGKKNLAFTIHVDEDVPLKIYTDGYRVEQILNNLLSNAFKFTAHGGITLAVTLADELEISKYGLKSSAKMIAFSVTDTGIGIPEDKLGVIFEAFRQENGTTSRKFGGTGLGLSISKELARLLGGKITVISKIGMGSTFTLYLPENYSERLHGTIYALSNQEASAAQEEMLFLEDILDDRQESASEFQLTLHPSSSNEVLQDEEQTKGTADSRLMAVNMEEKESALFARLTGKKILIVDDDIRNIFALSSVFEGYNMIVAFAENGQQALDIVKAQADFDLILMDIMMPEMDGYDTIKLLRSNPQFAELPIIALTAKAMDEDREQCFEAGASDYISKPIHVEQLLALMDHNLGDGENADGI